MVYDQGAGFVRVRYRSGTGDVVDTTLDRVDVGEVVAGLPVREFRWVKGQRHYSGWYWSATTGGLVVYESRLEMARIMLADFCPDVVGIAAQPMQLVGTDGDRTRRHVPDLLLVHADGGVTVVDVKSPHKRQDVEVRALMDWTRHTVGLRGWAFEEWYGAAAQVLTNVAFLAGYRRRGVVAEELIPAVLQATAEGASPLEIGQRMKPVHPLLVRPVVLHLVWSGRLSADLDAPLAVTSLLKPVLGAKAVS
jgi:hypothetical protein